MWLVSGIHASMKVTLVSLLPSAALSAALVLPHPASEKAMAMAETPAMTPVAALRMLDAMVMMIP